MFPDLFFDDVLSDNDTGRDDQWYWGALEEVWKENTLNSLPFTYSEHLTALSKIELQIMHEKAVTKLGLISFSNRQQFAKAGEEYAKLRNALSGNTERALNDEMYNSRLETLYFWSGYEMAMDLITKPTSEPSCLYSDVKVHLSRYAYKLIPHLGLLANIHSTRNLAGLNKNILNKLIAFQNIQIAHDASLLATLSKPRVIHEHSSYKAKLYESALNGTHYYNDHLYVDEKGKLLFSIEEDIIDALQLGLAYRPIPNHQL